MDLMFMPACALYGVMVLSAGPDSAPPSAEATLRKGESQVKSEEVKPVTQPVSAPAESEGVEASTRPAKKEEPSPPPSTIAFRIRTKHNKGKVRCGLYDKKKDWLSKRYVFKDTAVSHERVAVCVFKNVPPGRYAASAYHDANDNGRLDKNFFGLPKEDFTFSSGARARFGPPKFKDAAFDYTGGEFEMPAKM